MSTDLDDLLAAADPAPAALDADQLRRRDLVLERVLATAPPPARTAPVRRSPARTRPGAPRRAVTRVLLLAAAAAAVGGASVVLPFLDPGPSAYATWTSAPRAVAAGDLAVVDPVCRLFRDGSPDGRPVGYRLAATERRGDVVGLLYRSEDPDLSSVCVARQAPGSRWVRSVEAATGGSSGPASPAAPGGVTEGALSLFEDLAVTDGAVGEGVVGVTVRVDGLRVEATVSQGRYYAWWPTAVAADGSDLDGTAPGPPATGGEGDPAPRLAYDVRLADGTVRTDVEPTGPGR